MAQKLKDLIAQARKHDFVAWSTIMSRHVNELRVMAAFYFPDYHKINDIVQDTFVFAFDNLAQFKQGNFKAWLKSICRNMIRSEKKRLKRKQSNDMRYKDYLILKLEDSLEAPKITDLNECLAGLKSEHQQLVQLKYTQGHTFEKIATQHNKSTSWAKMTLLRIRRLLKQCLDRETSEKQS